MKRLFMLIITVLTTTYLAAQDSKLTGTVIGTTLSVDYTNFQSSTTANTREMAFDGNLNTCFASWDRSYTWVGLDLGAPHVITKVGWSPRNDALGPGRVVLGVFEGANSPDFMDGKPLFIITEKGVIGQMSYGEVDCSLGFRYVRYVGPADARCNIAELEFYGHAGEGDNSHLAQITNLPTVSIHTLDGEIPYDKEHNITAQIAIISDNGTKQLYEPGTIRERGNASRSFPKKPWRIKFDKKQNVLDAPAKAKKWTLINNYGDKTLMRNILAFELSRRVGMPYTPYAAAVDVVLNGEYKGCYQLCDQVEVNKNRVNITEMSTTDISGSALTGGYFVEVDAYAYEELSWFNSRKGNPVTIKSPDDDEITTEQRSYIESYFNKMEADWRTYLDLNTFLRHFIVGELAGNTDTYWSTYMYKQRDNDIMYTGPVWDFDLAFDNDVRVYPVNGKSDYLFRSGGSTAGNMRQFVSGIINDKDGAAKLKEIWNEVRLGGLTKTALQQFINDEQQLISRSATLNFMRWPILNEMVHQNPRALGSFAAEVDVLRKFMDDRMNWMDNKIGLTPGASSVATVEIDERLPYAVYSLSGQYRGNSLSGLPSGVYVVVQGQQSLKKVVR